MPETRQELLAKLTKAQHELSETRSRVTELEGLLSEYQMAPSSKRYEGDKRTPGNPLERSGDRLQRLVQRMEILHQIDLGLIRGGSIQALVDVTLKHLQKLVPCQRADVMIMDESTSEAVVFAVSLDGDTTLGPGVRVPIPPHVFDGYDARHVRVFADFRDLQDTQPRARRLVNEGVVYALSILLMDQEHPIGVLGLFADRPGYFTSEHEEIAIEIASQLAIAVHQLQLADSLAHQTATLEFKVAERTAALSNAKERVEAILNNSTDGILLVHEDLSIQQANYSFNRLFKCETDDYFGKSLVTLFRAEDADAVTKLTETAISEQNGQHVEVRAIDKEGKVFDAELGIGNIKDGGMVCTIRDITQRKIQERELRYYASLQESVVDAVIVTDSEFRIQTWNPGAERTYGWTSDEVIGKAAPELLQIRHPPTQDATSGRKRFLEQGFLQQETIQRRKDGADIYILGSATMLSDENGKPVGVISVNRDISDRKEMERQLRYQATLQHNVSDAVIVTGTNFRIQSWNKAAERIYGWSAEEVVNKATAEILPTEYTSAIDEQGAIKQLLEQGWWQGEVIQYHKNGSMRHILGSVTLVTDESGAPFGIVAVNHDITERKKLEQVMRESEARYHLISEVASEGIQLVDTNARITYLNPSMSKLCGYAPEEMIGHEYFEFIHPAYQESARQRFKERKTGARGKRDLQIRHKNGSYIWALVSSAPVLGVTGEFLGTLSLFSDINERKQAEEALRTSEEKFRLLLDAAPVATIISDQEGRITLLNVKAETVFGYNRTELIGQSVDMLIPNSARERHVDLRAAYITAPRIRPVGIGLDLSARRKDGSEFPVEIELSYIQSPAGLLVMSFVVDISDRKRVAGELERQRSFLRNVIDVSPSMIFVKDYDSRFVLANPLVAQLYNTTAEALIGKSDADFNPSSKEVDAFLEADRSVITSGKSLFIEEPVTNFEGETHWLQTRKVPIISADGQSKHVLGVATDITERKRAEAALQESEEKYRSLVETMRGGLAIFDLDNRITYVNDRLCELLGYSHDELIGTQAAEFVDDSYLPALATQLERRRQSESTTYELLFRHKNGDPVYMLVSGSPMLNKNGDIAGNFAVTTDITVQKQAEEKLQQALDKEKELSELKSRFVSMASHEFRTPLATILAATETLSAYRLKMTDEKIDLRLAKIRDQVEHLKNIMDDVLLLARMQARRTDFSPVRLDLDDLCRTILDEFQSRADVAQPIEYNCNVAHLQATLDKKLMRQIISNLVSNAIKYSPPEKPIKVNLESAGEVVVLRVSDQGIGIPESDLNHLFETFHRASNVGAVSGTGLGLVITKESVELHGGTIAVESELNVGTTFTVNIPITNARA